MSATVFYSSSNELATLTNTFKVNGAATDPTTVTLTITEPDGTTTAYTYAATEITRTGTGVYTKDVTSDSAGTWQYEWEGTGTATDAVAGTWEVQETSLGRLYCTLEALKSRLSITNTDDDLELHGACFGASRWVEQHTDRHFWRTSSSEVRTFVPDNGYCLELPAFNDLVSITTLKTDASGDGTFETTWTSGDYQLLPVNPGAAPETKPYTEIKAVGSLTFPWLCTTSLARDDRVQITGVFGWPAVPRAVKQAAALLAAELYRTKDAPLGVAGDGQFAIPITGNGTQLAMRLLAPYRRDAVLVA
jgi:hypothetical protein